MTPTEIARLALSNVGYSSTISDITEASPGARECNLWYDLSLRATLRGADWTFARRRQSMNVHASAPPGHWAFRYAYPADCVRFRYVENPMGPQEDPIPYRVEMDDEGDEKTVLCSLEGAIAVYTFYQTAGSLYTPHFIKVMSHALAHNIAWALTGKQGVVDNQERLFRTLLDRTTADDASEQQDPPAADASHILARTR